METIDVDQTRSDDDAEMHARRIEMSDGRYMIFFTFGDEPAADEQGIENV